MFSMIRQWFPTYLGAFINDVTHILDFFDPPSPLCDAKMAVFLICLHTLSKKCLPPPWTSVPSFMNAPLDIPKQFKIRVKKNFLNFNFNTF